MTQTSLDLIKQMAAIAKALKPITGRGIGYQLFVAKLIDSMSKGDMKRVYRLLKEARERGMDQMGMDRRRRARDRIRPNLG